MQGRPAPARHGPSWSFLAQIAFIVGLAIAQLAVGTSVSFTMAVALTFLATAVTLRIIGFTSIPGLLLSFMMLRYLVVSQIAKTVLGQPGNSNLAAPETTIWVICVGSFSLCAGIVLVSAFFRNRTFLQFQPTLPQLVGLRNVTLALGGVFTLIAYAEGTTDYSDLSYGGIAAVANEFSFYIYLAVMAETWVALTRSEGRRSTSPFLIVLCLALLVYGFMANSKQGIAAPLLAYLMASFSFRRRITRNQLIVTFVFMAFGAMIIYPVTQLLRGRLTVTHSTMAAAEDLFTEFSQDPSSLILDWELYKSIPIEELPIHQQELFYLGSADDLAGRFLLIANTDVIVNAVNEKGLYGLSLITDGFLMAMPTFLLPDKPRIQTCDLITWFYGVRPDVGEPGNPTIGLFADCLAAMGWPGVILLPFAMMLIFLPTIQLYGTDSTNNIIGMFLVYKYMQIFAEQQLEGFVGFSIRGLPFDIVKIIVIIFVVKTYFSRGRRVFAS